MKWSTTITATLALAATPLWATQAADEEKEKVVYKFGGREGARECVVKADGSEDCRPAKNDFGMADQGMPIDFDGMADMVDEDDPLIKLMKKNEETQKYVKEENERRKAKLAEARRQELLEMARQVPKEEPKKKEKSKDKPSEKPGKPQMKPKPQMEKKSKDKPQMKPKPQMNEKPKDKPQMKPKPQMNVKTKDKPMMKPQMNEKPRMQEKPQMMKPMPQMKNEAAKPAKKEKTDEKPEAKLDFQALLNSPSGKKAIKDAQKNGGQLDLSAVIQAAFNAELNKFGQPDAVEEEEDDDDDDASGVEMLLTAALTSAAAKAAETDDPFQKLHGGEHPGQSEYFAKIAKVLANYDRDDEDSMDQFLENLMALATPDHAEGDPIELAKLLNTTQLVKQQLGRLLKDVGLDNFHPLQFYYAMLHEEEVKNPVWKRHQHRYLPALPVEDAIQMADGLYLSQLAYLKDCAQIEAYVSQFQKDDSGVPLWTVRNCTTQSKPFQPAHFLMVQVKRPPPHDSRKATSLEAALVVRGSQTVSDFLSVGLMEAMDYPAGHSAIKGQVHEGMYKSARWLHEKYRDELLQLLADHRTFQGGHVLPMTLFLVGHSLGGGTAALASMEFNYDKEHNVDNENIDAYAVGFGTPAILSPQLSELVKDRITTVVCDSDGIPRLSAHTLRRAWERVLQYNFTDAALQDVAQLAPIVEKKVVPLGNWTVSILDNMRDGVEKRLQKEADKQLKKAAERNTTDMPALDLVPPGDCVHFYRDGVSWQGVYKPCREFDDLEIVQHVVDDHLILTGYYPSLLHYIRHLQNDLNWRLHHDIGSLPVGKWGQETD